ncbi:sensor histidine kinase [Paenibacillus camerounensis]|uniref:sensor histidine kinase n=1 Tax=Paenibacillus camerounensis TaxID=1243663 RepID=UPI000A32274C|nr:histidine kinase [Paenibacillus camerounensis]
MLGLIKRMKIFHRLVFFMLLLILLVCAGFLAVTTLSFKTYDEMLYEQASRAMNLSVSGIENEISNIEELSMNMALDSRIQEQLVSIQGGISDYERTVRTTDFKNKIAQYMFSEESIASIRFLNTSGYDFLVGQNRVLNQEEDVDGIVRTAHERQGSGVWIEPQQTEEGLTLAREVRSIFEPILEPLGTLIFQIDYQRLVERHFRPEAGTATELFVLSGARMLYRPAAESLQRFDTAAIPLTGSTGSLLQHINGKSYFLAYKQSPATGWTYISLIPYDEVFQEKKVLRNTILLIAGALLIIACTISYLFAKGFTRPIDQLARQMRSAEKGDFSASLLDIRAAAQMDEIGYLHKRFNSMIRNIEQLIDDNYKKQIVIKDTEYRALQAQINPHFLYNTLNSINWMARMRSDEVISTMVESLSQLLRGAMDNKRTMVTVREELELITSYMYIQKVRYGKRIDFSTEVDSGAMDSLIPKFALQPVVENAVYHAVDQTAGVCHITIHSEAVNNGRDLVFAVSDDGPGIGADYLERLRSLDYEAKGTGIGLRNIHERLQLAFGGEYGIGMESEPGKGTCVRITIPKGGSGDV